MIPWFVWMDNINKMILIIKIKYTNQFIIIFPLRKSYSFLIHLSLVYHLLLTSQFKNYYFRLYLTSNINDHFTFDIYKFALSYIYNQTHTITANQPQNNSDKSLLKLMLIIDGLVAVMPIVGLYSQYALIKERSHIGSFSIDTCAVLIFANILKIMFWFSKGFALNLLIQAVLLIFMTFALLALCIQVGYNQNNNLTDLTGKPQQGFWRWKSIGPFSNFYPHLVVLTVFFTTFMAFMTAFFVHFQVKPYGEVIGLVAIGIQCCLGFPQLYQNQKSKSVQGLSLFMIATWFFCDFFKTLYFIVMAQPSQFIIGGVLQLAVDVLIVIQIMAFRESYTQLPSAKIAPQFKDEIETEHTEKDYRLKSCDGI